MFAFDPSQKMMGRVPAAQSASTPAQVATSTVSGDEHEDFFHRVLDVINPLQHLPVVGTIYRAVTGEHIGAIEKIAGDALYGGMWGAITSTADVAFEAITGKSAEDTVLAWLKPDDTDTATGIASAKVKPQVAANAPIPDATMPTLPDASMSASLPDSRQLAALTQSLSAKGVDGNTAARALYAYRRVMGMNAQPVPVVASLN
jgi:hypothetical protein